MKANLFFLFSGPERSDQLFQELLVDLLATDNSRYFAKPRPIIINYHLHHEMGEFTFCEIALPRYEYGKNC